MSTVTPLLPDLDEYPTSDGRPVAETDLHIEILMDLRRILSERYANDPNVYVSGNNLMFYEPGNKRKHVSPDVYVVRGVAKKLRDNYLVWKEGKAPDFVMELTSASTRKEDLNLKFALYRDVLQDSEYFLFDPRHEYLDPPLRGFRMVDGQYVAISPVNGRLPSEQIGFHLEAVGAALRLFAPLSNDYLRLEEAKAKSELNRVLEERDAERKQLEEYMRRFGPLT